MPNFNKIHIALVVRYARIRVARCMWPNPDISTLNQLYIVNYLDGCRSVFTDNNATALPRVCDLVLQKQHLKQLQIVKKFADEKANESQAKN